MSDGAVTPRLGAHRLKTLALVVEHASFTRAAEILGISQPSVSQQIRELERLCELPLLEQRGRTIAPTSLGSALAEIGRRIGLAEERAEKTVADHRAGAVGRLTIGASMTCGAFIVPPAVASLRRDAPGAAVTLRVGNTVEIVHAVIDDLVDIAVVEGRVTAPELVAVPFADDRLVPVVGRDDPLAGAVVEPAALAGRTLIVREPGSGSRESVLRALADHGRSPFADVLEVGDAQALATAAAAGLGVAWLSERALPLYATSLAKVELLGLEVVRTFRHLRRRDRALTPLVQRFIAALAAVPNSTAGNAAGGGDR